MNKKQKSLGDNFYKIWQCPENGIPAFLEHADSKMAQLRHQLFVNRIELADPGRFLELKPGVDPNTDVNLLLNDYAKALNEGVKALQERMNVAYKDIEALLRGSFLSLFYTYNNAKDGELATLKIPAGILTSDAVEIHARKVLKEFFGMPDHDIYLLAGLLRIIANTPDSRTKEIKGQIFQVMFEDNIQQYFIEHIEQSLKRKKAKQEQKAK